MSLPRFYCPPPLHAGPTLELPPSAAHHAIRVLRLRVHDRISVFDGDGIELHGSISRIDGKRVMLDQILSCTINRESPLTLILAQALCSTEKMDWIIQKTTELGAAEIQPLQTRRSTTRLDGERGEKRTRHWHDIAISACEQCGRNRLPRIHSPQEFGVWLAAAREMPGRKFMLSPEAATTLHKQPVPNEPITLLTGPEGGFSEEEVQLAIRAGFIPVRMGPRVLRTETAALAGITSLQTLWGDFI